MLFASRSAPGLGLIFLIESVQRRNFEFARRFSTEMFAQFAKAGIVASFLWVIGLPLLFDAWIAWRPYAKMSRRRARCEQKINGEFY